jgi:hypothetical protein
VVHQSVQRKKPTAPQSCISKPANTHNDGKQAFSNLFGAANRAVIQEFASMEAVAAMPFDELVAWLDDQGKHRFSDPAENARKLQRIPQRLLSLYPKLLQPSVNLVLNLSLKNISNAGSTQQKRLDTAIAEQMDAIPHTLNTIPGFGPVLAAGIIAEIGMLNASTTICC